MKIPQILTLIPQNDVIYRYGEGGLNKFIGVVINKHEQTFEVIVLGLNNCRGLKESVPFVIPVAVTLI